MDMAERKRADEPRLNLRLSSRTALADDLAFLGRTVGPRRGPDARNHAQKEDYCLRRWLIAMAAADRLALPLTVEAPSANGRNPDFVLRWDRSSDNLGVEVTEAGDATWQQWLTTVTPISATGRLPNYRIAGYSGDEEIRIVIRDIEEAIRKKLEALVAGKYAGVPRCDLLIYENSEGGLGCDRSKVVEMLRMSANEVTTKAKGAFRQVHLLSADAMYLDLFGNCLPPIDVSQEHADGWSDWLQTQAKYLRDRNFNAIDLDNLAEELESLGKADQRAMKSQLQRLLVHLLKWQFQPELRGTSWRNSIALARAEIEDLLEDNPSFENRYLDFVTKIHSKAVAEAAKETGFSDSDFPVPCPYTVDQLRDTAFFPEADNRD